MQIKSARIKSYRSWRIDDTPCSEIAQQRHKKLQLFNKIRLSGCDEAMVLETIEVARATLFRWKQAYQEQGIVRLEPRSRAPHRTHKPRWTRQEEILVKRLRVQRPCWGKRTLTAVLKRDHDFDLSESTVGRILQKLIQQGKIKPVAFYRGNVGLRKKRAFNKHARRWMKGMKAKQPGELLQIDHMSVSVGPDFPIKHFKATCPITKITVAQAYNTASSRAAAEFLAFAQRTLPFDITSIQVDGGSEFMKAFEGACQTAGIKLFVLPPRSPELNGCVERRNRTFRYEFYQLYEGIFNLDVLRLALAGYLKEYNTYRPHQALNMETPMAYYQRHYLEPPQSHMC